MSQQTMQSLVDSLCRCFGSTPINHQDLMDQLDSLSLQQQHQQQTEAGASASRQHQRSSSYSSSTRLRDPFRVRKQVTPPTPEMKKRTRSLQLKDKQWDALFSTTNPGAAAANASSATSPTVPQDPETPKSSNHHQQRTAHLASSRKEDFEEDDEGIGYSAVEQARAVAEAKKMAASAGAIASSATNAGGGAGKGGGGKKKGSSMHKRKRSSSGTRDDIFRSKRNASLSWGGGSPGGGGGGIGVGTSRRRSHGPFGLGGDGRQHPFAAYCGGDTGGGSSDGKLPNHSSANATVNRISRFLSNHPVFASSLCFATPVTDSADEADYDEDVDDYDSNDLLDAANGNNADEMTSVVSGDNTLNTAEDTITSTLYYETTTLAGLKQTSPPMPLFNSFCVDERDDIHRIISTNSHMTSNRSHHQPIHSALPQPVRRPLTGIAGGGPATGAASRARQSPSPKGTPTRPPSSNGYGLAPPTLRLSPKRHSSAAEVMTFARPAGGSNQGAPRSAALVYADSSSPPPPVQTPPQTPPPTTTATAGSRFAGPAHGRLHQHRLDDGVPATVSSSDSSRSQNHHG